jgi:ABC-type arginine/histidine transport system permease subunit
VLSTAITRGCLVLVQIFVHMFGNHRCSNIDASTRLNFRLSRPFSRAMP